MTDNIQGPDIRSLINKVESFILSDPVLSKEIVAAKGKYEEDAGRIKDSFPDYENRITSFLYWFIFEWTSRTLQNQNPIGIFFNLQRKKLQESEREIFKQLINHRHSLFEFIKIGKKESVIYDLFAKKKIRLKDHEMMFGMEPGQYFETRIFQIDKEFYFAPYLIKHPHMVRGSIYTVVKKIRKLNKPYFPFLIHLQYLQFKFETFPKFDFRKIYNFDEYKI